MDATPEMGKDGEAGFGSGPIVFGEREELSVKVVSIMVLDMSRALLRRNGMNSMRSRFEARASCRCENLPTCALKFRSWTSELLDVALKDSVCSILMSLDSCELSCFESTISRVALSISFHSKYIGFTIHRNTPEKTKEFIIIKRQSRVNVPRFHNCSEDQKIKPD